MGSQLEQGINKLMSDHACMLTQGSHRQAFKRPLSLPRVGISLKEIKDIMMTTTTIATTGMVSNGLIRQKCRTSLPDQQCRRGRPITPDLLLSREEYVQNLPVRFVKLESCKH